MLEQTWPVTRQCKSIKCSLQCLDVLSQLKILSQVLLTLGKTDSCVPSSIALNTEIREHQIFLLT